MADNDGDYGWQRAVFGMKKFHYFVEEPGHAGQRFQRSLCGKWLFDTKGEKEDTRPPFHNKTECVACIRKFEIAYGKSEGAREE